MYILQEHVLYSERIAMVYDITSIINECMIFSFFRKSCHPGLRINKRVEQDFFSNRIITLSSRGVNKKNTITDFMFAVTIMIAFFSVSVTKFMDRRINLHVLSSNIAIFQASFEFITS